MCIAMFAHDNIDILPKIIASLAKLINLSLVVHLIHLNGNVNTQYYKSRHAQDVASFEWPCPWCEIMFLDCQ